MAVSETEEKVVKFVQQHLKEWMGETWAVTPGNSLRRDFGLDDLDMIELCIAAEDEFSMEITDHSWERVYTVRDIIDLVVQGS